jgi:hypothetical protein
MNSLLFSSFHLDTQPVNASKYDGTVHLHIPFNLLCPDYPILRVAYSTLLTYPSLNEGGMLRCYKRNSEIFCLPLHPCKWKLSIRTVQLNQYSLCIFVDVTYDV